MKNITIFRDSLQGYLYYKFNGKDTKLKVEQGNVFKIEEKDFDGTILSRIYEFNFYEIQTEDGIRTFMFTSVSTNTVRSGSGGRTGVSILDEGTSVGFAQNINFTGAGVSTTFSNGQANVTISGGMGGGGTLNYIAKFTPDGSTLGNSLLFDNGTSVLFGGIAAIPSAGIAITSTTQGFLVPRMTTAERNLIGAPATGLLVYNTSTSLFSYWDGAAWQNIDSQAGGDVSGSGTTNFITKWTDGPNSVIGDSLMQDNGTNTAINRAPVAGSVLSVQSNGTTSATFIADFYNSTPTAMVRFRSDGYISAGLANGSMTIGLSAGFVSTLGSNTFVGVSAGAGITTGIENTAFGHQAMTSVTSAIDNCAFGYGALRSMTTGAIGRNNAFGVDALFTNAGGQFNNAFGWSALKLNVTGNQCSAFGNSALSASTADFNDAFGSGTLLLNTSGTENAAFGFSALRSNITGTNNVSIGGESGFTSTGSRNIFIGNNAGFWETGSETVIIDNRRRSDEATARTQVLIYGKTSTAAPVTSNQFIRFNANVGILTNTFGTSADGVIGINNGTAPTTSPADMIQIFSVDIAGGGASLGLRTEQTVEIIGLSVLSQRFKIKINGTEYYMLLDTV